MPFTMFGAFRYMRRPFCSLDTTITFVRHASSIQAPLSPELRQQRSRLLNNNSVLIIPEQRAIKCWVDASIKDKLIAVVIENKYKIFRTKPQVGVAGRNIHWAESVALELLIHILLAQRVTGPVTAYSDSQAALGAFYGLKSRDPLVAASSVRLQDRRDLWPFRIQPEWVASKQNVADPFTRGKPVARGYQELPSRVMLSETLKRFVYQD